MSDYSIIRPKLSGKELELFRKRLDRRGGMKRAAEATRLCRGTIRNVAMAGCGSDETIVRIKKFITSND